MAYLMGIDIGGTMVKAAIYDMDGNEIAVHGEKLHISYPHSGQNERDMYEVKDMSLKAIKDVIAKAGIQDGKEILSIGITGKGNGAYMVDKDGAPTWPGILSSDARSKDYIKKWLADGTFDSVFPQIRNKLWTGQTSPIVAWFKDHEPEVLNKTAHVGSVKDYIRYILTGNFVCEITEASSWNVVDMATGQYADNLFEAFGIAEYKHIFPPIIESCETGGTFVDQLDRQRYELLTIGITKEGRWLYTEADSSQMADGSWEELPGNMPCVLSPDRADHGLILFTPAGQVEKVHVDVVIPVLHGLWGEDGTVQGLLELAGIPYVGCGVLASAVCMDKAVANAMFDASGIPHTKWLSATRWEIESDPDGVCDGVIAKLGWPIFVKPANAGSSVGITKAHDRDELKAAIRLALANDRKVVFEAFVDGHEVECAVIGSDPAVSTRPGEILAGAEFYTYDDKYKNGVSQVVIPAKLPEEKLDEVKTYAAMAYTALGCEGLARCDFFVEKDTGRVLINEINTFPGFTPISMYPKLMEHEGIPVPALIDRLIALALERTEKQHG